MEFNDKYIMHVNAIYIYVCVCIPFVKLEALRKKRDIRDIVVV